MQFDADIILDLADFIRELLGLSGVMRSLECWNEGVFFQWEVSSIYQRAVCCRRFLSVKRFDCKAASPFHTNICLMQ